jgi:glycosyltransferase involved in cell wall biosynthesis
MQIAILSPSAGLTYCENCRRDRSLWRSLRQQGHQALLVPVYIPPATEPEEADHVGPLAFGALQTYMREYVGIFRLLPRWLVRWMDSTWLLNWLSSFSSATSADDLVQMQMSMLEPEKSRHARDLQELIDWLKTDVKPDLVIVPSVLLVGLADPLADALNCRVFCMLQDELPWLEAISPDAREKVWSVIRERSKQVDAFISVSQFYADAVGPMLQVDADRLVTVPAAVDMEDLEPARVPPSAPVVGYLGPVFKSHGVELLLEAFIILHKRGNVSGARLKVLGQGLPDKRCVRRLRRRIAEAQVGDAVDLVPQGPESDKGDFLRELTVLSVPTTYPVAFAMFVIEALASAVPVVQPRHGCFVETVEKSGGGVLVEPNDAESLADGLEQLLADPLTARSMGEGARRKVRQWHDADTMTRAIVELYEKVTRTQEEQDRREATNV